MSDPENQFRTSYEEVDDVLLVQCYDYETSETHFYKWDDREAEKIEEYHAKNGARYFPNKVDVDPREQTPLVRMASRPVDYESFDQLVSEVRNFIHKYGDISELEEKYCAYYVLLTWVYDRFRVCPYLRFIGDAGKGKTRLLKTVGSLCFFAKLTGISTKSAAIRSHSKWQGTSLFNEADGITGDETNNFTRWVNNGFEKGNPVEMSVKDNPQEQERFDTFGPKLFACKRPFEDPATESRVISIEMEETNRDDIPIYRPPEFEEEALEIRNKLLQFRFQNYKDLEAIKEPDYIKDLDIESRIKQMSLPLLPIIEQHGEEAIQEFKQYLIDRQKTVTKQRAQSEEGLVFNKLHDIATGEHPGKFDRYRQEGELIGITASMIAEELGYGWTDTKVGRLIRALGFESVAKNVELKKKNSEVGFVNEENPETERVTQRLIRVPSKQRWDEAVSRYLVDGEASEVPDCLKGAAYTED